MTAGLVSQNQVATFTTPVNGTSPIDANQVRSNDNVLKTSYDTHDADGTIHLQSSTAAARAAAGTAGRKWITSDTLKLYYDNGVTWDEIANFPAGGTILGAVTITSNSANALAVGPNGTTNPAFKIDGSTASLAAGLELIGATAAGTVALRVISSGADANLGINAKGAGTIAIGSVSTGAVTITPALNVTGTLTGSSHVIAGASSALGIAGRSVLGSAVDGNFRVSNNAATDFGLFQFGGTTSSFPALKRSTTGLIVRLADDSANTTLTASRLIGGTDISSAVATGVFGDGTYSAATDAAITTVTGSVTSVTNATASGTIINHKTQLLQSVATTGTVYASHNVAQATHTSGTVAALVGSQHNVYATGSGGTSTAAVAISAGMIVGTGATVTTLTGVQVAISSLTGTVTTAYGMRVLAIEGATTNWALYCASSTTSGGVTFRDTALATTATVGHLFIPSSAGVPTGVPATIPTGQVALQFDTANNRIYIYDGAWLQVGVA